MVFLFLFFFSFWLLVENTINPFITNIRMYQLGFLEEPLNQLIFSIYILGSGLVSLYISILVIEGLKKYLLIDKNNKA